MKGFSLIELLVAIAIIGILSAIGIPSLLGSREKAQEAGCDGLLHSLDAEIANELDTAFTDDDPLTDETTTRNLIAQRHANEKNPMNRTEKAFIFPGMLLSQKPCQVQYEENGGSVLLDQQDYKGAWRSFRIALYDY